MSKLLVVCDDTVGKNMAGPAIRYVEFSRALSRNHDVTLAASVITDMLDEPFSIVPFDRTSLRTLANDSDVLIMSGFILRKFPFLKKIPAPVVVDIYDPFILENLEIHRDRPLAERTSIHAGDLGVQLELLLNGDFFLCASERQRDFWLGMLTALGRINPEQYDTDKEARRLIDVVPFGIPAEPPEHLKPVLKGVVPGIRDTDKVLLWGGGIWNWFDPLTTLKAMIQIGRERDDIKLFFLGTKHPNPDIPEMDVARQAVALAQQAGLTGRTVFFNEWAPYEDRQNYLLEADAGISLHFNHLETKFSFRTRILDCIWASLPVITTVGDSLSEEVEKEQLGLTVEPEDINGTVTAILRLLDDSEFNSRCRENLVRIAPDYYWRIAAKPLIRFCDTSYRTRDVADSSISSDSLFDGAPRTKNSIFGRIARRLKDLR